MSYKAKQFVVRGFDVANTFNSRGFMDAQPAFLEEITPSQHQATVKLLTNSTLAKMANPLVMDVDPMVVTDRPVDEVRVKIFTHAVTVDKHDRQRIFMMVKAWAEKSRIKGKRGWRANAVRELRWERDQDSGKMVAFTTVLLGTQVFYTDQTATASPIDAADFNSDVDQLHRELSRTGILARINVNHRMFGLLTV